MKLTHGRAIEDEGTTEKKRTVVQWEGGSHRCCSEGKCRTEEKGKNSKAENVQKVAPKGLGSPIYKDPKTLGILKGMSP